MKNPESTKQKTLILAAIVLMFSWGVGYIFLNYQFQNSTSKELQKIVDSTQKLFTLKVTQENKNLINIIDELLSLDGLTQAVSQNNYKKISFIITPHYKHITNINADVNILTFRSKDGVILFRAHRPDFYGDFLNENRRLIVDTNIKEKSFSGFEVTKLDLMYRSTQAIFYKNKFVGSVEIGVDPNKFIQDLSLVFDFEIGLAINKTFADSMLDKNSIYINEKYILIKGSEHLQKQLKEKKQNSHFKLKTNVLLKNHLSTEVGVLLLGFDISSIEQANKEFMNKLLYLGLSVALVLIIVLYQGFEAILKYYKKESNTDRLTKLKNRQALNSKLFEDKKYVLILSNIKEFSLLNELYGVDIGNEVLQKVAQSFEKFATKYKLSAYRISSDEYVLLKEEESFEAEEYDDILQELHEKINSLDINIQSIGETISVEIYSGIAFGEAHSLLDAQMALKKAKEKSLPYLAYSQNVDTKEHNKNVLSMKRLIRDAILLKEIIPFFQPITDRNGKIIKYEALVRIVNLVNGKKNIIFPDDFLPIAMKSGLYMSVAKEMLTRALTFFALRDEKISVNFLPNDFFNASIMDTFLELLEKFDSPQQVVVEITEQEGVEDFDRLLRVVQKLRKIGVLIAIDDFGSGYANYAHILKIKPDYLKIDGSIVRNILEDEESKILVKSIINFTKDLGIKTIAEYIENEEIFELLKEYGVDEFQGYYFGRPQDLINS
ncbi:EAL domain-containing protein [Sulfurimonas sp.]|uniref:EAL domain-containing protein n=1 Tax=Sulfurimonas sp. TaxID=2022749 RepID=UPI002AB22344|nr:EAL domain-containing protein [Sulfurimonas sp.]